MSPRRQSDLIYPHERVQRAGATDGGGVLRARLERCGHPSPIWPEYWNHRLRQIGKLRGNYPLTVGIHYLRLRDPKVSIHRGRFRVEPECVPEMRVPDLILKCVGFIGGVHHEDATGIYGEHDATGFFVAVPCESPELKEMQFTYFVTAKHVAEDYKDADYCFWVNKKHGGVTTIPDIVEPWWIHPTDKTADIAAMLVVLGPYADIVPIAVQTIGVPENLKTINIGIGDEVYSVGLFREVDSTSSMMPIVRHGNISMMPPAQIQTKYGFADVILVEARSIGGISGSPVFTRHTLRQPLKMQDSTTRDSFSNGHGETLLGLVHGHWDVKDISAVRVEQDRQQGVNYGIAIVVPAIKIYETLYQEGAVAMRRKQEQGELNRSIPGTDSARNPKPFTKSDFETALKTVSRKLTDKE